MNVLNLSLRFAVCASMAGLAACSGGGGGNSPATAPIAPVSPSTPVVPVIFPPDPPPATLGNAAPASLSGGSPTFANGNGTPNFTTGMPAVGTVFALNQSAYHMTATMREAASVGAATLTFDGLRFDNQGVYHLKVPSLSINTGGIPLSGVEDTPAGGAASIVFKNLNYTVFGYWSLAFPNNTATSYEGYQSFAVSGYQTPPTSMPSAGSANYLGTGNVSGILFIGDSDGTVPFTELHGDASLTANFSGGSITGKLTDMTAFNWHGKAPWNTLMFSGSISGSTISGTTTTSAPPPYGPPYQAGLPEGSSGTINGAFYGPQAEEVGAVWTVSGGGKSAVGVFAATKQ